MMHKLFVWIEQMSDLLVGKGWNLTWVKVLSTLFILAILVSAAVAIYWIVRIVFRKVLVAIKRKQGGYWPDVFLRRKLLSYISYLFLVVVYSKAVPYIFEPIPDWIPFVNKVMKLAGVYFVMQSVISIMWAVYDIRRAGRTETTVASKGLLQFVSIAIYFISAIVALSVIFNKAPGVLLGGLGAASAVLMLIFKDSITGLVAGVQISHNDMVRIGDWITMPSQNVDGDIIDISLTTVKVRNFDLTIVSIPTYTLITQSVQNWRGIKLASSRRMMKLLHIDLTSIRFCTPENWETFRKVEYLAPLFREETGPVESAGEGAMSGSRWVPKNSTMTNLEVYMFYLTEYLRSHPRIRKGNGFTLMVRQLTIDDMGLPIQIYCFTDTCVWEEHEAIMNQITAYATAMVPLFGLNCYQRTAQPDNRQLDWADGQPMQKA